MSLSQYPLSWQVFKNIDVLYNVTDYLPLKDVISVLQVCKATRREASHIYIRQFHRVLYNYVTTPHKFRNLLREHQCVISGSSVVWLIQGFPSKWYPNDLDVYVPLGKATSMAEYFIQEGYHKIEPMEHDPESKDYALLESHLASITKLKNKATGALVDILESPVNNAALPVIYFHSTVVMNYISADTMVLLYPRMTLTNIGMTHRNGRNRDRCVTKYWLRGFDINLRGEHAKKWAQYVCWQILRADDDADCLKIIIDPQSMTDSESYHKSIDCVKCKLVWRLNVDYIRGIRCCHCCRRCSSLPNVQKNRASVLEWLYGCEWCIRD